MSRFLIALLGLVVGLWSFGATTAEAQNVYRLKTGDTVRIEVLEDPSLNQVLLVAPDGRITVPLVGGLQAGGRSLEAIQDELIQRLAPNFATPPTVFVALQSERPARDEPIETRTIDIYVVGEANRPGRLEVEPDTIVLQLFAEMGGFTNFAATKRLQLRRGSSTFTLNYKDIEAGTSNSGMLQLQDGDVLVVPQRRLFE